MKSAHKPLVQLGQTALSEASEAEVLTWDQIFIEAAAKAMPACQAGYPAATYARRIKFVRHVCSDVTDRLRTIPGERAAILDIGGNSGWLFKHIIGSGAFSIGMDRVLPILRVAEQDQHYETLLQADGGMLPFADETFEVCTIFDVLTCSDCPRKLLTEAYRVLKNGGTLVVESSRSFSLAYTLFTDAYHQISRKKGLASCLATMRHRIRMSLDKYQTVPNFTYISSSQLISWCASLGECSLYVHTPVRATIFPQSRMAIIVSKNSGKRGGKKGRISYCATCRKQGLT